MNLKKLVSDLTKKEGKKSNVKVGDVREIIGLVSDEIYKNPLLVYDLYKNGKRRKK